MGQVVAVAPPQSAAEMLDSIERSKGGGASLHFTQRNLYETLIVHWGMTGLAVLVTWLWLLGEPGSALSVPAVTVLAVGIQIATATVASVLAWVAYSRHYSYVKTDLWDTVTTLIQLAAVALGTVETGGSHSPLWFVVIIGSAYLSTVLVYSSAYFVAAGMGAAIVVSAALNDQWTREDMAVTIGAAVGIPFAFLIMKAASRALYDAAEGTAWEREVLRARVIELSGLLSRAAAGDLSVAGSLSLVVSDDRLSDDHLQLLAGSFDETLGSLRSLVGSGSVWWGSDWVGGGAGVGGCAGAGGFGVAAVVGGVGDDGDD